jgi:cobyrinic acid a,c-diamide synthase
MSPVAKMLDTPVLFVTCGGIGRPIDEVMLNKAVFDNYGVKVFGVIVNKVIPEKIAIVKQMIKEYVDVNGLMERLTTNRK